MLIKNLGNQGEDVDQEPRKDDCSNLENEGQKLSLILRDLSNNHKVEKHTNISYPLNDDSKNSSDNKANDGNSDIDSSVPKNAKSKSC